jgi:hypothetical protein
MKYGICYNTSKLLGILGHKCITPKKWANVLYSELSPNFPFCPRHNTRKQPRQQNNTDHSILLNTFQWRYKNGKKGEEKTLPCPPLLSSSTTVLIPSSVPEPSFVNTLSTTQNYIDNHPRTTITTAPSTIIATNTDYVPPPSSHDIIPSIVASKPPLFKDITTTQPNPMILSDKLPAVLPVRMPVIPPASIQPTTLNTPVRVVHNELI